MNILEQMSLAWQNKMPFAVYRKPQSKEIVGLFQENTELHLIEDFTESGFIMAPFSEGHLFYIPTKISRIAKQELLFEPAEPPQDVLAQNSWKEQDKKSYITLVQKCKTGIALGLFDKVVSSRVQEVAYSVEAIDKLFVALCTEHPTAFVSVVSHPDIGTWLTATPETLLRLEQQDLYTMALAGTQVNLEQQVVEWGEKEKEEQQYVTDFIIEELRGIAQEVTQGDTYTKRAGKVMHICTDIQAKVSPNDLALLLKAIHPTPAVCGMPKHSAREFLIQNEGYNRAYYAGYLGMLNFDDNNAKQGSTQLYVNLRCMQLKQGAVLLYVGGGITAQSDPESEFEETVNKSTTMGRILI